MSSDSPSETLYSSDGVELATVNNAAIPTSTRGILAEGSDGYKAHFIKTDGYGDQIAALTDGYNGIVGVAPSSTAATTTQPALVVTLSPNTDAMVAGNTTPTASSPALVVTLSPNSIAQQNATGSGTITALNGSVVAGIAGYGSAIFNITGTWSGSLTSQATDGDGTWINVASLSNQSGLITQSTTINGSLEMNPAGWTQARLTATAWTSGTATITWSAGNGSHVIIPYSPNGINFQTNTALVDSNENFIGVTPASTAATAAEEALVVALSPNSPVPAGTNTIGVVNQGTGNATIGNAWYNKLTDGTNGPVAVKAPSTAAVAADPALVVAISPNNSLSLSTADITATGALNALNAAVQVSTAGEATAGFQLASGTLIGTIVCESSFDGGTTWNQTYFDTPANGKLLTIVFASANAATAATIVGIGGTGLSRVRVSAYTSGTANVTVRSTTRSDPSTLFTGPPGIATAPPDIAQVGGAVTTSAPTYTTGTYNAISLDTAGNVRVNGSGVTQPVSGTVTANAGTGSYNNASVGAIAATAPADATYVGAAVTTNAPTYTTGQMDPLSLTTGGLLRIDGVFPINATTPTTDVAFVGGAVTTNAPTYTTGQLSALSLDTAGNLRVNASGAHIKGTIQPLYDTNNQSITITITAAATGTARASTAISNTTNLYEDVLLFFSVTTPATGVSATGYFNFYGYGSVNGGTTYPEGITGTDAAVTLYTPTNLVLVAQMNANAVSKTFSMGPISFCRLYGLDRLPAEWGIVSVNQSGATPTAGTIIYQGVNGQLV